MATTSAILSSTPGFLQLQPTATSSASVVDTTVRDLLRTSLSSSADPLTGVELYDFKGKYQEARQLLTANNLLGARALLLEILDQLVIEDDNDHDLIFRAECKIGVAYTHSNHARTKIALDAKKDLDLAVANHKSWQPNDQEFITHCFQWLKALYGQFVHLLPHAEPALKKDILEKTKECCRILGIPSPNPSPKISRLKPRRLRTTPPQKTSRTVTIGPVDESWKKTKLLVAFAFAGVVIASFAFFIRRFIIRLN